MSFVRITALAILLLPLSARALSVQDDLSCPSESQLRTSLAQHAPSLGGSLSIAGHAGEVDVHWAIADRKFSRVVTVSPRDCAAAAETVSLLVAAWQRTLPTSTSADPLDQAAHVTATRLPEPGTRNQDPTNRPQPATRNSPEPKAEPTSITPAIPDPADAGSGSVTAVADAGGPPSPTSVATAPPSPDAGVLLALADPPEDVPVIHVEAPPSVPEAKQASPWHLAAGVNVSGALGIDQSASQGGLGLAVELGRGDRWAGQLVVAAETSATEGAPETHGASVQRQSLALQAVARFHPIASHPAGALRLEGDPLLARLHAWSVGLSDPGYATVATVLRPGVALGAAYEERIGAATFSLGPEVQALQQSVFYVIENGSRQDLITTPYFYAGLTAGLRANFF